MQTSERPKFEIVAREDFSDATYLLEVLHAPGLSPSGNMVEAAGIKIRTLSVEIGWA